MFKYSVRSELTRKYYERRIRIFFDFIKFSTGSGIEERCNLFARKGKKDNNWTMVQIIRFLQYEKERVDKGEITAATLSNFVKSIKLYCEMCDIPISWKKITRGLPRPRGVANDRAPTIEEIRRLVEYPDITISPCRPACGNELTKLCNSFIAVRNGIYFMVTIPTTSPFSVKSGPPLLP